MDTATDRESVAAYMDQVLAGSGWQVAKIRLYSNRLEPPESYWSLFNVDINKDEEERRLRLVAKGALNPQAWSRISQRVGGDAADGPPDPIHGRVHPQLFDETRHAYWFYPYDPSMPSLPLANDPVRMAGLLLGLEDPELILAASRKLDISVVRYLPETGAIIRYTFDAGGIPVTIYGKVQPGRRGLRTHRVVEGLWRAAAKYPGYLNLPRPLGYSEEMGMLIEEGIRGKPVSARRQSTAFETMPIAAADALAVIHESGVETDERMMIDAELERLDRVTDQFAYVHPNAHFLLRDLVTHMRERVTKSHEEDVLPTHGDLKYDQFVYHNDQFTLLDFDYYMTAETSYDLGKFCAYLMPSNPTDWMDSVVAEKARVDFIRRYRELRPDATLQRFGVYEALQFALRAMSLMWAQVPGWEAMAETFLVLGFERLNGRLPE
jgi:Phosphotransferase enzyme family